LPILQNVIAASSMFVFPLYSIIVSITGVS